MRRLVRVQHYRCGEWHGDTYALSPDDASDSRIETDVRKAFDHYMQAKQEFVESWWWIMRINCGCNTN